MGAGAGAEFLSFMIVLRFFRLDPGVGAAVAPSTSSSSAGLGRFLPAPVGVEPLGFAFGFFVDFLAGRVEDTAGAEGVVAADFDPSLSLIFGVPVVEGESGSGSFLMAEKLILRGGRSAMARASDGEALDHVK